MNEKPSERCRLKWEVSIKLDIMKEYWRAWTEFI